MNIDTIIKKQELVKLGFLYRCKKILQKERERRINSLIDQTPSWFGVSTSHFNQAKALLSFMQEEGGVIPEFLTYFDKEILFDPTNTSGSKLFLNTRFSLRGIGFFRLQEDEEPELLGSPWHFKSMIKLASETDIENLPLYIHEKFDEIIVECSPNMRHAIPGFV